jgi:hypothetical protein
MLQVAALKPYPRFLVSNMNFEWYFFVELNYQTRYYALSKSIAKSGPVMFPLIVEMRPEIYFGKNKPVNILSLTLCYEPTLDRYFGKNQRHYIRLKR